MIKLILIAIWLLANLAPPVDPRYHVTMHAQPVTIASDASTPQIEAVSGENEATHTRPPVSTPPPDWSVCQAEGCVTPPTPLPEDWSTCQAEGCTSPELPPGWERVPERP